MKYFYTRCVKCGSKIKVSCNKDIERVVIMEVICCEKKNSKNKTTDLKKGVKKQ